MHAAQMPSLLLSLLTPGEPQAHGLIVVLRGAVILFLGILPSGSEGMVEAHPFFMQ